VLDAVEHAHARAVVIGVAHGTKAYACLLHAAVQSVTEQLDHMAVDDQPSALTPPVLDSSASGSPQPAQPPPAPDGDTALPAAQADRSELTSEQQSVVTALAEMDSRCFVMHSTS
jgi:hypothetical protein